MVERKATRLVVLKVEKWAVWRVERKVEMKAEMKAVQKVDLQVALWVVWRAVT